MNEWLSAAGQVEDFLGALERKGWIKRHCPPQESRFWNLIEGSTAAMFGVFSGYEKQLLRDWMAGDWQDPKRQPSLRRKHDENHTDAGWADDPELKALQDTLSEQSPRQQLESLIPWPSAQRHCRPAGLYASRRFIELRTRLR